MANPEDRWPENVSGRFYVDEQSIDCDLSRELAPKYFLRQDENCYYYVYSQPDSGEGMEECAEAMDSCPVEAIGNDGS